MGKMSMGLRRIFDDAVHHRAISLDAIMQARRQAENLPGNPSIKKLVASGSDPQHAVYVNTLNLISLFCEQAATLLPLHKINDFMAKWQEIYQPAFPPMSPITGSFFNCWTLLDAAFGPDKETVGTCFLAIADRLGLDAMQIQVAKNLNQSRMGLYEVIQRKGQGKFSELRELITDKRFTTYFPSGYQGNPGDILWVRLVPPLSDSVDYYVAMTTPYRLLLQTTADWLQYFERHGIRPGATGVEAKLHAHMKYGKNPSYWSEFIFYGYSNYAADVILLTGFPDQPQTQPAHREYRH